MPSPCFFPSPPRVCEVSAVCFRVYLWPPVSLPPLSPVLVHPVPPSVSLLFYVSLCLSPFPIILRHDSAWPSRDNTFHRQIAQQRQKNMLQVNVRGQALLHVLWRGRRGEGRREVSQVGVPPPPGGWLGGAPRPSCVGKAGQEFCADPALVGFQAAHLSSKANPLILKDKRSHLHLCFLQVVEWGRGRKRKRTPRGATLGHLSPIYVPSWLGTSLSMGICNY